MLKLTRQKGLSLIELMIGLLVGAIVAGGAISVFTNSLESSTDNIELARLNQDLRAMMDIMVRDIRRAGYVTDNPAANSAALQANPYLDSATPGLTTDIAVYNNGSCIVYAYNRDNLITVTPSERLGFKLDNGELKMRKTGATNENCSNTGGNLDSDWETITDPDVQITALAFTLAESELSITSMLTDVLPGPPDGFADGDDNHNTFCDEGESCNTCNTGDKCLYIRTIDISLAGELKDDPGVTQTITEQIRVRNDKYVASAP